MRQANILRGCDALLRELAAGDTLLAFDFDGTLAPIVAHPERARMRAETRRRFAEVARAYPCIVVSGRAAADVRPRLEGAPVREVIGNHGLEPSPQAHHFQAAVRRWLLVLRARLAHVEGAVIEDKGASLAIHHRHCRPQAPAVRAIREAVKRLGPSRTIAGKCVLNVLPIGGLDKGVAVERARERLDCERALYVGDDVTDEDVFKRAGPALIGVRVGASRASAATHHLSGQRRIDALLRRLLALRAQLRRPGPG